MIKTFRLLNKVEKNIKFELTDLLINQVIDLVDNNQDRLLLVKLNELHHADIAEILEELNVDQSTYIIKLLESDKTSEILMELDEDFREQILNNLSPKEIAKEIEELEKGMSFLASIGSVGPFIGLLGTVWGIVNAFQSIAISNNTSLAVVAPGIAEALFATALGLLAAIPAVAAYNKFSNDLDKITSSLEYFSIEFLSKKLNEIEKKYNV